MCNQLMFNESTDTVIKPCLFSYKTAAYENEKFSIMKGKILQWDNAYVMIFNYNLKQCTHFDCNKKWKQINIPIPVQTFPFK